ncbi:hypothetical protein ADK56_09150 [Streptomyces sp. MMG1522]|nr:hypothetical protein ADK88_15660 [Streptomyces sp. NRRL F-2295]KOU51639.1 hypothetical protein ADK56_09150 [Streptomyces sp. MMG1522]
MRVMPRTVIDHRSGAVAAGDTHARLNLRGRGGRRLTSPNGQTAPVGGPDADRAPGRLAGRRLTHPP